MIVWLDGNGLVSRWVQTADVVPAGAVEIADLDDPLSIYVDAAGAVHPLPPRPGETWAFDRASGAWIDIRTSAEILDAAWEALRAERDRRLTASDRYVLPDYPITEAARAAWLAYRQALRDLPELTTDPTAPIWPVPPQEA